MDIIKALKEKAKEEFKNRLVQIEQYAPVYRKAMVLENKLRAFFPDCSTSNYMVGYMPVVKLYLTGGYNIQRDVNLFLEKEEVFIDFLLNGAEMPRPEFYMNQSLDFHLNGIRFEVYYNGGRCVRKQVGTKTVEEPIYEVECE